MITFVRKNVLLVTKHSFCQLSPQVLVAVVLLGRDYRLFYYRRQCKQHTDHTYY